MNRPGSIERMKTIARSLTAINGRTFRGCVHSPEIKDNASKEAIIESLLVLQKSFDEISKECEGIAAFIDREFINTSNIMH